MPIGESEDQSQDPGILSRSRPGSNSHEPHRIYTSVIFLKAGGNSTSSSGWSIADSPQQGEAQPMTPVHRGDSSSKTGKNELDGLGRYPSASQLRPLAPKSTVQVFPREASPLPTSGSIKAPSTDFSTHNVVSMKEISQTQTTTQPSRIYVQPNSE